MSMDELFERFDEFDLEGATKLTPREFAKLHKMAPQMVYYYIRTGVLTAERCACGRTVVDVESASAALQAKKEARRKGLQAD